MRRRPILVLLPLLVALAARWPIVAAMAAEVVDSAGRTVQVPDKIARVLAAGPPAAVLLAAVAPDLMMGWPGPLSAEARPLLAPAAANLDPVPRLTGREDVTAAIEALKPDLIVDYGDMAPRYVDAVRAAQEKTGIPTVLIDGALTKIPAALRTVGGLLHREARAETLALYAESLLALPPVRNGFHRPTVVYARGADGLNVAAPGSTVTEVFAALGWRVLAPEGTGSFRPTSIEAIRALDPDVLVFADPGMRDEATRDLNGHDVPTRDPAWKTVRAVREGHALVAPNLPFGWIEDPPSINRLLGLAWLGGHEPASLAASFNAVVYGHVLLPAESGPLLASIPLVRP